MAEATPSPRRIAVKLFASPDPGPELELEPFIGLFHRFVQEKALEGLLIDVADYAHVPEGPGILLVGHDVDYGIDLARGRTGLLTLRKRHDEDVPFPDLLRDTLRRALAAARAVEASGVGSLRFRVDGFELHILDRLVAPNTAEAFEALRVPVETVVAELYGDAKREIAHERDDDVRGALAFRVVAQEAPAADVLLGRLPAATARAPRERGARDEIDVHELERLRASGADFVLLDVRNPDEYETCNLGGRLIPLPELEGRLAELEGSEEIVVHCKVGGRGAKAAEILRGAGFARVRNLTGGIFAWIDEIDPSLSKY